MARSLLCLIVLTSLLLASCATLHAAKFCPGCGAEVGPDWKFCEKCGRKLGAQGTAPSSGAWQTPGTRAGQQIMGPDGGPMVWVPAGVYWMGSLDGSDDEGPETYVRITHGFWLGKHEVTNEQYMAFLGETGKKRDDASHALLAEDGGAGLQRQGVSYVCVSGRELHPVTSVTWYGAAAYAAHFGGRLPTEAQWEYAARGPDGRKYPWGDSWDAKKCCCKDNAGPGKPATMPVGSPPTGASWFCGATNMAGNVTEWCGDWYARDYYKTSPSDDPRGPSRGEGRVVRGGSHESSRYNCTAIGRASARPDATDDVRGFRIIVVPKADGAAREALPEVKSSFISISGKPKGAKLEVDGRPQKPPPCLAEVSLRSTHRRTIHIKVSAEGYTPHTDSVVAQRGKRTRVRYTLVKPPPPPPPPPPPRPTPWLSAGRYRGQEITGPNGGKMVWVPPGEFMMGSGDKYERPVHKVRITKGFWLGKHEVTKAQYRRFCQDTNRSFPSGSSRGDTHPMVDVSWYGADNYCRHYELSLPTEAQWEYAARGPEGRRYPWGPKFDSSKCCYDRNKGWAGRTFPVGSFPKGVSWCGALDMAGNALEWCRDWYASDYYGKSPVSNPTGPTTGEKRILRGGWWGDNGYACNSACRFRSSPSDKDNNGFRCSKTP